MAHDPAEPAIPSAQGGGTGAPDARETSRDSLLLVAELGSNHIGGPRKVKVRNLSAGGMMADADFSLPTGAAVEIGLRNIGQVPGTVIWVHGTRFGIAFARHIDPRLVRNTITTGESEAPVYARPRLPAAKYDGWNGKLRPV